MGIFDLFSKRRAKERGELPDVFQYNELSDKLRRQIVLIWQEPLEYFISRTSDALYDRIARVLRKERGQFSLADAGSVDWELTKYFLAEKDVEHALDVVEVVFREIVKCAHHAEWHRQAESIQLTSNAIDELNARFRENGVGYQFVRGEIVRVDSALLHAEVVKPALRLLNRKEYEGAEQEFLRAHEHYRNGHAKEAINECLKAFESTMKSICDRRGWQYPPSATATGLINVCLNEGLIPKFWEQQCTALRSLLESGIPPARNRLSGHGQGQAPTDVPTHLVAFMLHMTASVIVFLVESAESST